MRVQFLPGAPCYNRLMNQKRLAVIMVMMGIVAMLGVVAFFIINQQKTASLQNQATCIPEGGLSYENVYSTVPVDQRLKCCSGLVPQEKSGVADEPAICVKPTP